MLKVIARKPGVLIHIEMHGQRLSHIHLLPHREFAVEMTTPVRYVLDWLEKYAAGRPPPFPFPLNLNHRPPFSKEVLETLAAVPFGEAVSYSELGNKAGYSRAARAVGGACGANPYPLLIPCHRVVRRGGQIGGFSLDLDVKKRLLDFEGISYK
jgi:O-6-methylguanine DNA methyltransferase